MGTMRTPEAHARPVPPSERGALRSAEAGFTLVEILVVVIIIGLLAAIAIPVLLNQRRKAIDATVKSDLSAAALSFEAFRTNAPDYPGSRSEIAGDVTITAGTSIAVYRASDTYCLVGTRVSGTQPTHAWVYMSDAGGLQAASVTACSGPRSFTLP